MSDARTFVVVGAGFAGAKAVQTLREEGFAGRVVLIGNESVRPYDHVPLSKEYLRGKPGKHKVFVHDEGYYQAHDIDLRLDTTVAAIDPADHQVTLDSGEQLGWDALLLATGSEPRRLTVPGADLDGVHYLRSLADADRLRERLSPLSGVGRIAVVGAGWIGCEIAASAREMGIDVALIGRSSLPMESVLGPEMASFYRDVHVDHGVELHLGQDVTEFRGTDSVQEVVLGDGQMLAADAVVAGIGALPRVALAEAAGMTVDNGIVTDEFLATSVPGVFAAGDVANAWISAAGSRRRLEHWSAALVQGPVAARNMLGQATAYQQVPFFFTDQYDVWMEYTGAAAADTDQLVVRTLPGEQQFIAFWLRDDRVTAGMNINIRGVPDDIAALITSGQQVDPAALADPDVELTSLVTPVG